MRPRRASITSYDDFLNATQTRQTTTTRPVDGQLNRSARESQGDTVFKMTLPLGYWKQHCRAYPRVANVALDVLSEQLPLLSQSRIGARRDHQREPSVKIERREHGRDALSLLEPQASVWASDCGATGTGAEQEVKKTFADRQWVNRGLLVD
jgi:hypothetical protein